MSQFISLRIKDIIKETPSAVSLVLEIPPKNKEDFNFIAGQFITLKVIIDDQEVRRAYSISSQPGQKDLQISVKKIADGKFSTYANDILKVGDTLKAMIPEGKFQLQPNINGTKNYMAFAAGSGITPIMSMIKTVLSEEKDSKFVLVYGNKTAKETMFFKELLTLQTSHPDRLFIDFVYSKENNDQATFGRIEKNTVDYALKSKYKEFAIDEFYLCGPEGMITMVSEVLEENKVPKTAIHFELFTTNQTTLENNTEGTASIKAIVDDETFEIIAQKKTTLLDAILENDIDAPYSCKGGVCCSCICRVTSGKVDMPVNNLLTNDEIEEGLVLACQAYAKSDAVEIDFDDA